MVRRIPRAPSRFGPATTGAPRGLSMQAADAVSDVLARELSKVQLDEQHLLQPLEGLESESKWHAEFVSGDRKIGTRYLYGSRSLELAAEEGPGLPGRA